MASLTDVNCTSAYEDVKWKQARLSKFKGVKVTHSHTVIDSDADDADDDDDDDDRKPVNRYFFSSLLLFCQKKGNRFSALWRVDPRDQTDVILFFSPNRSNTSFDVNNPFYFQRFLRLSPRAADGCTRHREQGTKLLIFFPLSYDHSHELFFTRPRNKFK